MAVWDVAVRPPREQFGYWREVICEAFVPLAAVDDEALAALFTVETENGPRYWLGLNNFYVITRYNRSVNYALVVLELAGEVRAAKQRAEPSSIR